MLNKKVLVGAIFGALFVAGNAAAVDFTAKPVVAEKFAKELKLDDDGVLALSGDGTSVIFKSGLSYENGDVKYFRVEAAEHVALDTPEFDGGDLTVSAVDGEGTNVITFKATAGADVAATDVLKLDMNAVVEKLADSNITVTVYESPAAAQQGGTNGQYVFGKVAGPYITFASSLAWDFTKTSAVASVYADPSFTQFNVGNALVNGATLAATPTLSGVEGVWNADSTQIEVEDVLDLTKSTVVVSGDFSYLFGADGKLSTAASVTGFGGVNADVDPGKTSVTFDIEESANPSANFAVVTANDGNKYFPYIAAGEYTASLKAVANAAFNKPVVADAVIGEILHDGTTLQAPLAQVPGGYLSRLVLTNTGNVDREYTISVMGEKDSKVTAVAAGTKGVIPANGTKVIDDLTTVFKGGPRATLNVDVAGPYGQIEGLYQIVNPAAGSVSNHVLTKN